MCVLGGRTSRDETGFCSPPHSRVLTLMIFTLPPDIQPFPSIMGEIRIRKRQPQGETGTVKAELRGSPDCRGIHAPGERCWLEVRVGKCIQF